jgi:hypothetical protein
MGLYPVSLLSQPIKQWGQSQPSVDDRLLGLLCPYLRHTIGMFNTCSQGSMYRSLIDTCGGYNLVGVGLPHHTPRPSQSMISAFHLGAPPGLQFNQLSSTKPKFKFKEHMTATWSSDHSAIYRDLHVRLAIPNNLSLVIGIIRIDQKVSLCN